MNRTRLFIFISLAVTASTLAVFLLTGLSPFSDSFYTKEIPYSDYFYQVLVSSDGSQAYPVGKDTAFPAFSYLLYRIFYVAGGAWNGAISDFRGYMHTPRAMAVFYLYNALLVLALYLVVRAFLHTRGRKCFLPAACAVLLSYPFLATSMQRGNSVAFAAIFLAMACLWMTDEAPKKKEGAIAWIAAAAGLKIIPAVYGLIYVKRREWKRGMRLLVLGLIVFFVPFLFFGGSEGLGILADRYLHMESERSELISAKGFLSYLFRVLFGRGGENAQALFSVLAIVFCVLMLLCFFLARTRWQETLFLSGLMIAALKSNHGYVSVYLLVPLLLYLRGEEQGEDDEGWRVYVNTILFAVIFSVPWFFSRLPAGDTYGGIHAGVAACIYALLLFNALDVVLARFRPAEEKTS